MSSCSKQASLTARKSRSGLTTSTSVPTSHPTTVAMHRMFSECEMLNPKSVSDGGHPPGRLTQGLPHFSVRILRLSGVIPVVLLSTRRVNTLLAMYRLRSSGLLNRVALAHSRVESRNSSAGSGCCSSRSMNQIRTFSLSRRVQLAALSTTESRSCSIVVNLIAPPSRYARPCRVGGECFTLHQ
jgi:hypothetical protein